MEGRTSCIVGLVPAIIGLSDMAGLITREVFLSCCFLLRGTGDFRIPTHLSGQHAESFPE